MTIGEVCLLTNDVPRLAGFYKLLLGVENGSDTSSLIKNLKKSVIITLFQINLLLWLTQ